jgi:CelD/BcsL family acetyltransferase involved in cellulose biosynthesis
MAPNGTDKALTLPAAGLKTAPLSTHVFAYHRPIFSVVSALFSQGARDLIEPCGAHHPAWLSACLAEARIISVRLGQDLTGIFATSLARWRWGVPLPVVTSGRSDLAFDGTPLIAKNDAVRTIEAFLTAQRGRPVLFETIPLKGAFLRSLKTAAYDLGAPMKVIRQWERAALQPHGTYEQWFDTNFDRKRRKEYRRLRTRLSEQGRLESLAWRDSEPVQRWIDELFDLEAKGWKGREKTAIANDPAKKAQLTRALHALARERALRFWKLSFKGEPIAMMFALVSSAKAWLGKIAYDEAYAKYSPGVLLILDATQALFADEEVRFADSCAIPGHPMIDNIWRERILMGDVLVGAPGTSGLVFNTMARAEAARGRVREAAKHFYYRITKRRMS